MSHLFEPSPDSNSLFQMLTDGLNLPKAVPTRSESPATHEAYTTALNHWIEAERRFQESRSRLERLRERVAALPSPSTLTGVSPLGPLLQDRCMAANQVADVGSTIPKFPYYGYVKRLFARLVARPVLFLAGIVTAHQRVVNHALLEAVQILADRFDADAGTRTRLEERVQRVERVASREELATLTYRTAVLQGQVELAQSEFLRILEQAHRHGDREDDTRRLAAVREHLELEGGRVDRLESQAERLSQTLAEQKSEAHELRSTLQALAIDVRPLTPLKENLRWQQAHLDRLEARQTLIDKTLDDHRRATRELLAKLENLNADTRHLTPLGESLRHQQAQIDRLEACQAVEERALEEHGRANRELLSKLQGLEADTRHIEEISNAVRARQEELQRALEQLQPEVEGLVRNVSGKSLAPDPPGWEEFYVEFENRFRGSREVLRERLIPNLSIFEESGVLTEETPLLDIGCGRGEWLELLREKGLAAKGLETNGVMAKLCHDLGLSVLQADALAYLRHQPEGRYGAVTAYHVIEHLSPSYLIRLLQEIYRVLRPGGIALLESPNPENFSVSSLWFHLDPTHRHPIHPETLRVLIEHLGFIDLKLQKLDHLRPQDVLERLDTKDDPVAKKLDAVIDYLNARFAAPPDYSVIARKPD